MQRGPRGRGDAGPPPDDPEGPDGPHFGQVHHAGDVFFPDGDGGDAEGPKAEMTREQEVGTTEAAGQVCGGMIRKPMARCRHAAAHIYFIPRNTK